MKMMLFRTDAGFSSVVKMMLRLISQLKLYQIKVSGMFIQSLLFRSFANVELKESREKYGKK